MTPPRVLAIAGSDSGGGAGIQADIKTVGALGGYCATAITAVTAQNTLGVTRIDALPPESVIAQIDAVLSDIGADAIKTGMLGSAETTRAVADRLGRADASALPVVFDPVMVATTGARLAPADALPEFARLMAHATVSTPNLEELAALIGRPLDGEAAIGEVAAWLIAERGSGAILVTGVRLPGDIFADLLFGSGDPRRWSAPRIDTQDDHGTGCTLSSAIAVGLAAGLSLPDAIGRARDYVREALLRAPGLGAGAGPLGHLPVSE